MLKEFKEFIAKGNVLDLAVGVVIGAAFGKIVDSLVNDLMMPPIGLILGKVNFADLYVALDGKEYASLAAAKEAGAATFNYGNFITTVIQFLLVAFAVFLVVKQYNRLRRADAPAPAAPTTKDCPHCLMTVPIRATKCGHCTSSLAANAAA